MSSNDFSVSRKNQPMAGVGFTVFVVFLILKLVGVVSWSWWWVTAPLWGPIGLILLFALIIVFLGVLTARD